VVPSYVLYCVVRCCPFSCTGPATWPSRYSFITYKWGAAGWGEQHMFMFHLSALMTLQKATLDTGQLEDTLVIVSYRRLAPKFQHSLSAVTLGTYLDGFSFRPLLLQDLWSQDYLTKALTSFSYCTCTYLSNNYLVGLNLCLACWMFSLFNATCFIKSV
jgi:hypothetical protein